MTEQTHKLVFSMQPVRLASRRGHVINVPARAPTRIPQALFLEAARLGCVDYSDEMVAALAAAVAAARAIPVEPEPQPAAADVLSIARDAVRHVLLQAGKHPELLTANGMPRLPAVRTAYDTLCSEKRVKAELKITSDLIMKLMLEIQEQSRQTQIADANAELVTRYPGGVPQGDLEGEEVGGVSEDSLERISGEEE